MITLKDLMLETDFFLVKECLKKYYCDDENRKIEKYSDFFDKLIKTKQNSNSKNMNIYLAKSNETEVNSIFSKFEIDETIDVYGKDDDGMGYSLVASTFENWLGYFIDIDTLKKFENFEIIAHCLWEMTYFGFDDNLVLEEFSFNDDYLPSKVNRKKLLVINGPMGVGKTTVSNKLNKMIESSIWLDGDWCWSMNPFVVNEENKKMVIDNISYLLRNFLNNDSFKLIIFCWVLHDESIFEMIKNRLDLSNTDIYRVTLLCSEEILIQRINNDENCFSRDIEKSLQRMKYMLELPTNKIDTSNLTIEEIVDKVIGIIKTEKQSIYGLY